MDVQLRVRFFSARCHIHTQNVMNLERRKESTADRQHIFCFAYSADCSPRLALGIDIGRGILRDHVIEQAVLPRTLEGGSDRFRAVLFDERDDISGELRAVSPLMYWRRVEHAFRRALWAAISDRRFSA